MDQIEAAGVLVSGRTTTEALTIAVVATTMTIEATAATTEEVTEATPTTTGLDTTLGATIISTLATNHMLAGKHGVEEAEVSKPARLHGHTAHEACTHGFVSAHA